MMRAKTPQLKGLKIMGKIDTSKLDSSTKPKPSENLNHINPDSQSKQKEQLKAVQQVMHRNVNVNAKIKYRWSCFRSKNI